MIFPAEYYSFAFSALFFKLIVEIYSTFNF